MKSRQRLWSVELATASGTLLAIAQLCTFTPRVDILWVESRVGGGIRCNETLVQTFLDGQCPVRGSLFLDGSVVHLK